MIDSPQNYDLTPDYTEIRITGNGRYYSIYVSRRFTGTHVSKEKGSKTFKADASIHSICKTFGDEEIGIIVEEAAKSEVEVDLKMSGLKAEEEAKVRRSLISKGLEVKAA